MVLFNKSNEGMEEHIITVVESFYNSILEFQQMMF